MEGGGVNCSLDRDWLELAQPSPFQLLKLDLFGPQRSHGSCVFGVCSSKVGEGLSEPGNSGTKGWDRGCRRNCKTISKVALTS